MKFGKRVFFLALLFLGAFFWSHNSGQNKDLYTPSVRILFDDEIEDPDQDVNKS